jgi:hypothetical protein
MPYKHYLSLIFRRLGTEHAHDTQHSEEARGRNEGILTLPQLRRLGTDHNYSGFPPTLITSFTGYSYYTTIIGLSVNPNCFIYRILRLYNHNWPFYQLCCLCGVMIHQCVDVLFRASKCFFVWTFFPVIYRYIRTSLVNN